MISSTELLVIGIITTYTLVIVIGIHKYEAKIKDLRGSLSDLKRAYSLSKSNGYSQQHYTQLQLENKNLRSVVSDLDNANELLKKQIRQLKETLVEPPLQYESSKNNDSL
jgi:hypothetical protein